MSLNKFTHILLLKNDTKLKKKKKWQITTQKHVPKKPYPVKIEINYHSQVLKNQKKKKIRKKREEMLMPKKNKKWTWLPRKRKKKGKKNAKRGATLLLREERRKKKKCNLMMLGWSVGWNCLRHCQKLLSSPEIKDKSKATGRGRPKILRW